MVYERNFVAFSTGGRGNLKKFKEAQKLINIKRKKFKKENDQKSLNIVQLSIAVQEEDKFETSDKCQELHHKSLLDLSGDDQKI